MPLDRHPKNIFKEQHFPSSEQQLMSEDLSQKSYPVIEVLSGCLSKYSAGINTCKPTAANSSSQVHYLAGALQQTGN